MFNSEKHNWCQLSAFTGSKPKTHTCPRAQTYFNQQSMFQDKEQHCSGTGAREWEDMSTVRVKCQRLMSRKMQDHTEAAQKYVHPVPSIQYMQKRRSRFKTKCVSCYTNIFACASMRFVIVTHSLNCVGAAEFSIGQPHKHFGCFCRKGLVHSSARLWGVSLVATQSHFCG